MFLSDFARTKGARDKRKRKLRAPKLANGEEMKPNKIYESNRKNKKKMVWVKRGNKAKLVHFGDDRYEDYTQHKDKERRKNYLRRSANIRNKEGKLTRNDPFSANYYARRHLW